MSKKPNAKGIEMPEALKGKYEFTRPMLGGPVYDFPQYNLTGVNLAEMSEKTAERLFRAGWKGIRKVEAAIGKSAAPAPPKSDL